MDSAGAKLSDYFTDLEGRGTQSPTNKHGSEDAVDKRSPKAIGLYPKALPESPFVRRNEKTSETGLGARPSPGIASGAQRSRLEGELPHEAEVIVNPIDWQCHQVINFLEEQGV